MPENHTISKILQDRALPDYIQTEYPVFVEFIDAYFTWLEQQKNTGDITQNLRNYRDIDNTLDEFIEQFTKETMVTIPKSLFGDKRLLVKHIKDFYLNKGNEASYRFLFQILYNEEIEFYYPKVDILRASDGKWYEEKSLKISFSLDALQNIQNSLITGSISGAQAIVETSYKITERGTEIIELSLSNIRGDFQSGEDISFNYFNAEGNAETVTESILNVLTDVIIDEAGSGYSTGDRFDVVDSNLIVIATGTINDTSKGGINSLIINDGGTGYRGNITRAVKFFSLPINWDLNGDILTDVPMDGSGSGTNGIDYTAYTIDETISEQDIPDSGDPIQITDSLLSFGEGASGIVTVVNDDGVIQEVAVISEGTGYQTPTASVISTLGTGADIGVVGGGGKISQLSLDTFPIVLDTDYDSNGLTIVADMTEDGDGNALTDLSVGVLAEHDGVYLNDDGHLSSTKRLQDNFFYQDFSYVIKTGQSSDKWNDIINNVVHPAGLAMFGEVDVITNLTLRTTLAQTLTEIGNTVDISDSSDRENINIADVIVDLTTPDNTLTDSDGDILTDADDNFLLGA